MSPTGKKVTGWAYFFSNLTLTAPAKANSTRCQPGTGDTSPPQPGMVRMPDFINLGHELCGHAVARLNHLGWSRNWYPYSMDDPVIQIENAIRAEHSTYGKNGKKKNIYGQRHAPDWYEVQGVDLPDPGKVPTPPWRRDWLMEQRRNLPDHIEPTSDFYEGARSPEEPFDPR